MKTTKPKTPLHEALEKATGRSIARVSEDRYNRQIVIAYEGNSVRFPVLKAIAAVVGTERLDAEVSTRRDGYGEQRSWITVYCYEAVLIPLAHPRGDIEDEERADA